MRQDFPRDMRQGYLSNLTCVMGINTQQRYAILTFLKIDRRHREPLSRVPHVPACSCNIKMLAHSHNDWSKAGDQSGLWSGAHVQTLPSLAR